MKKLLVVIIAIVSLNSCKKDDTQTPNYQGRVYVKIETVDVDGVKSYSDIKTINIK